ncbi:hypothetical protein [Sulfurimonas sp.]|jgi:hypothetical protein|nr:hypothetical protein [Sulfurimonas sp.]MDY0124210.1 hypothetical protein [Sulfurimonas sp.]
MFDIDKVDRNIEPKLKRELVDAFMEDNKHLDFVLQALKKLN